MILDIAIFMVASFVLWQCIKWTVTNKQKNKQRTERLRIMDELRKRENNGK